MGRKPIRLEARELWKIGNVPLTQGVRKKGFWYTYQSGVEQGVKNDIVDNTRHGGNTGTEKFRRRLLGRGKAGVGGTLIDRVVGKECEETAVQGGVVKDRGWRGRCGGRAPP